METRKSSKGCKDDDGLALVKAAAWAWYEHGSGSEGQAISEFDLSMPKRAPKPSRYKLEAAMKETRQEKGGENAHLKLMSPPLSPLSSSNSEISLLDDYEIDRITKQLDLYIESSRAEHLRSVLGGDHRAPNKVASFSESGTSERKTKKKLKNNNNSKISSRGLWLKYTAVCGSSVDDVVADARRSSNVAYPRGGQKKM